MADLNELLVFARVVEAGSFTAAAKQLGMPKSTVSRRVSQLEERLGARLLERTTRSLSLTEAGEAYFARAARISRDLEEAEAAVQELHSTPTGTLRLTAPVEFGRTFLGDILVRYLELHPRVRLEVRLSTSLVDVVSEGYDLAIRAGNLPDSSLMSRKLGPATRHLLASPAYLRQRGRPRRPADLADHDCILFSESSRPGVWHLSGPDGPTEVTVRGRLSVNSFTVMRQAALAGLGVTMLPTFVCSDDVEAGRLEVLLGDFGAPVGALWAVYPGGRNLSAKLRAFLDLLDEMLAPAPWMAGSP